MSVVVVASAFVEVATSDHSLGRSAVRNYPIRRASHRPEPAVTEGIQPSLMRESGTQPGPAESNGLVGQDIRPLVPGNGADYLPVGFPERVWVADLLVRLRFAASADVAVDISAVDGPGSAGGIQGPGIDGSMTPSSSLE